MGKNGGWVKIIFNETFYEKYPISWVFGYVYGLGRYTQTHTQSSWFNIDFKMELEITKHFFNF